MLQGHVQRTFGQLETLVIIHRPADHATAVDVDIR